MWNCGRIWHISDAPQREVQGISINFIVNYLVVLSYDFDFEKKFFGYLSLKIILLNIYITNEMTVFINLGSQ